MTPKIHAGFRATMLQQDDSCGWFAKEFHAFVNRDIFGVAEIFSVVCQALLSNVRLSNSKCSM